MGTVSARSVSWTATCALAAVAALSPGCKCAAERPKPLGIAGKTGTASIEGAIVRTQPLAAQAGGPPRGAFAECPPAPPRPEPVAAGKVNEALVWISDGLPPGDYPIPKEPLALDQKGCEFSPRVFGIRAGQDLVLRNSDPALHNVHALGPGGFNLSMPQGRPPVAVFFPDPRAPAAIACDVHPWMRAYALISTHPFFAVTAPDGAFALRGLPAGKFTLSVWHERLGERSTPVSLNDTQAARMEIALDGIAP